MSRIDGLNPLIEALRRRIADSARRLERADKASSGPKPHDLERPDKSNTVELQKSISERIRTLDQNEKQHYRKATRIFLESVLVWEFGQDLVEDERFTEMLDELNRMIDSDADLRRNMHSLLDSFHDQSV